MNSAILITKRIFPEAVELLRRHTEVDYVDSDEGLTPQELEARSRGKQAIISQLTDKFTDERLAKLNGVRVIANVAVGFDNVDLAAATRHHIAVTNTPDVLTDTTADLTFALLLAAARRIVEGHQFVHSGKWQRWTVDLLAGHDIHHKTMGIFGMGRIGQAVARRALGFSMRVLYNDARRAPEAVEKELQLEFVSKDQLLAESDFVSLHVPLIPSTRHLIGPAELSKMKSSAIIVNSSRGPVIDEAALADALSKKVIAGAGLDVFENEPNVHPLLLELDNAVLAPHIGSASIDTRRNMSMLAAESALAVLEGRRPANLLNPEALD
jgi:lactate dehydrogenase-like 2-hydroxyacid dehydrogenase